LSINGNTAGFWNITGLSLKKEDCELTSIVLCSLFWISWPLKLELTQSPTTLVGNYHSVLHNISTKCRSHMTISCCRSWFDSTRSGSEWSRVAWSSSVFHTCIQDDLTYLSAKFKEKNLTLHSSKYGNKYTAQWLIFKYMNTLDKRPVDTPQNTIHTKHQSLKVTKNSWMEHTHRHHVSLKNKENILKEVAATTA